VAGPASVSSLHPPSPPPASQRHTPHRLLHHRAMPACKLRAVNICSEHLQVSQYKKGGREGVPLCAANRHRKTGYILGPYKEAGGEAKQAGGGGREALKQTRVFGERNHGNKLEEGTWEQKRRRGGRGQGREELPIGGEGPGAQMECRGRRALKQLPRRVGGLARRRPARGRRPPAAGRCAVVSQLLPTSAAAAQQNRGICVVARRGHHV
jgi:hypothetical protein